jgi:hypothetical protein
MHRGLLNHPRMRDLAERLDSPLHDAVGIVEMLFHYSSSYCPNGAIGKFSDDDLAHAVGWRKSPSLLVGHLVESRWIEFHAEKRLVLSSVYISGAARNKLPKSVRSAVLAAGACAVCGSADRLTVDHVKPLCKGGTDDIGNLQCLCGLCNCKKAGTWAEVTR